MAGLRPRPSDVIATYDRLARDFDAQRTKCLFEAPWLEKFAAKLPKAGRVLDVGCGTGTPIARWFLEQGFTLSGVDGAVAMIDLASARWPDADWRVGDMTTLDLGQTFDGVIAWNSLFHLTPRDQRKAIGAMARHLRAGGVMLTTVGDRAGETQGYVAGQAVYHASLSQADYAHVFGENGMTVTAFVPNDPQTRNHSVLMAQKPLEGDAKTLHSAQQ